MTEFEGNHAVAVFVEDEQVGYVPKDILHKVLPLFRLNKYRILNMIASVNTFYDKNKNIKLSCNVRVNYCLADENEINIEYDYNPKPVYDDETIYNIRG